MKVPSTPRHRAFDEPLHIHWYTLGHCISEWGINSIDKLQAILINIELNTINLTGSSLYAYNRLFIVNNGVQRSSVMDMALEGVFETFNAMFDIDTANNSLSLTEDGLKHLKCTDYENNPYAVHGSTFDLYNLTILPKQESFYSNADLKELHETNLSYIVKPTNGYTPLIEICEKGNFEEGVVEALKEELSIAECITQLADQSVLKRMVSIDSDAGGCEEKLTTIEKIRKYRTRHNSLITTTQGRGNGSL